MRADLDDTLEDECWRQKVDCSRVMVLDGRKLHVDQKTQAEQTEDNGTEYQQIREELVRWNITLEEIREIGRDFVAQCYCYWG